MHGARIVTDKKAAALQNGGRDARRGFSAKIHRTASPNPAQFLAPVPFVSRAEQDQSGVPRLFCQHGEQFLPILLSPVLDRKFGSNARRDKIGLVRRKKLPGLISFLLS